jgi:hypothetical protein
VTNPNTAPVVPAMTVEARAQQMFEATSSTSGWDDLSTADRSPYRVLARHNLVEEAIRRGDHQVMKELQGAHVAATSGGVPRGLVKADAFSRESGDFAAAVQELCDLADMVEDLGGRYVWDHLSETELDQYATKMKAAGRTVRGFLDLV